MKKIVVILLILGSVLFLFFKNYFCTTKIERINIKNNNEIELIAKIKNCGATSGYIYNLYMVKKGGSLDFFNNSIFEAKDITPNIYWKNNHIIIESNSTRIYKFTNFKYIDNREYFIKLISQ